MQLKNGIYHLTNEEYHALPAISSSHLVLAREALRKFWYESSFNPNKPEDKETKALRFGRAMHTYLLEPDRFAKEYRVAPDLKDFADALVYVEQLKAYATELGINIKGLRKEQLEQQILLQKPDAPVWSKILSSFDAGAEAGLYSKITPEESELTKAMANALADEVISLHDTDSTFTMRDVFTHGKAEETFIWQEPSTGLWLKVRSDWRLGEHLIFEYRTARDASPNGYSREVVKRNYHIRAGMYHHVIQQVTQKAQRFVYIAQEKEPPYLCGGYEQTQTDLESGWTLALHLLTQVKRCMDKGDPRDHRNWTGYNDGKIAQLFLSDYAMQA